MYIIDGLLASGNNLNVDKKVFGFSLNLFWNAFPN